MTMRLAISSAVFDVDGDIMLDAEPTSDLETYTRRVARTATLDGGAHLDDMGYAEGDRTLEFEVVYTQAAFDLLRYLIKTHFDLRAAKADGFFTGTLERVQIRNGAINCRFLVKSGL